MRRSIVMAGAAVAALLTVGTAAGTPVAGAAPRNVSDRTACPETGDASARLRPGADATDPNTLSPAQARSIDRTLRARLRGLSPAERSAARRGHRPVVVDVYWQVITHSNGTGNVTNARLHQQLQVLNDGYAGTTSGPAASTRFSFETKRVIRTANTDWYNWADPQVDPRDDRAAKSALHRGGRAALNVYVANLGDGLLGYATFPGGSPALDGVVVLNASLPGGNADPFNLGDTLTHEVGHWLGLYHTFQGGCSNPGDAVADTPQQDDGGNIFDCVVALDTCAASGTDPVRNFMNYVDDACMNRFTPGQATRMSQAWDAFRA
jgi:hypothetical protein